MVAFQRSFLKAYGIAGQRHRVGQQFGVPCCYGLRGLVGGTECHCGDASAVGVRLVELDGANHCVPWVLGMVRGEVFERLGFFKF